jgi:hypothetical protein
MAFTPSYSYSPTDFDHKSMNLANVSSYFARPSKVVKPNSRNNSPRTLGRRKTTSGGSNSSRTRSVVDGLRSTGQWQPDITRSRPQSWHPSQAQCSTSDLTALATSQNQPAWDYATAEIHGLVTPLSYPAMNAPQFQEVFTPLDHLSTNEQCHDSHYQQSYMQPVRSMPAPLYPSYREESYMSWRSVPTAPPSPEITSAPVMKAVSLSPEIEDIDDDVPEKLVGLGLYDSPTYVQSSSLLFGDSSPVRRKALKLEEAFEPTEQDDEQEEANADDQDDEDPSTDVGQSWPQATTDHEPYSLSNHFYTANAEPDPLASKYLASLLHMDSAYYATAYQGYGWI